MESPFPKNYKITEKATCPIIGQGSSGMNYSEISEIIYNSIKLGNRLIDTASVYNSEKGIGLGIKKALNEKICKREDLFIITKFYVQSRNNPELSLQKSLSNLQIDYVDLFLDHWPVFYNYGNNNEKYNKCPLHIVWEKMEKCVEKKLTKFIGGSNYNVQTLMNLLSFCKIKPSFLEIEFHPYLYQKNLIYFCKKENIRVISYNPLCKGNYDYHEGKEKLKLDLLNEKVILDLSKKYNKTSGQIVLNWHIKNEVIPIPMTNKKDRMKENLDSVNFKMENEDYEKISLLNKNYRFGSSLTWGVIDFDIFA